MGKRGLSIPEVVARSGLGRTTVFKCIRDGRLIAHKVGGRTLVMDDDLDEFLVSSPTVRPASEQKLPGAV